MLNRIINKYQYTGLSRGQPLDEIMMDGGFINIENLEAALARKKETNEQLGEMLVSIGAINSVDLDAVLSVQRDLSSLKNSVKAAAGIRQILGELLLQAKNITCEQLDVALREKHKSGDRLEEVFVRQGLLSGNEFHAVLTFHQNRRGEMPFLKRYRLGNILVDTGKITRQQLEEVIAQQKISKKAIGELLVEAGYSKQDQIDNGLKLQHKLVAAAIFATLSVSNILAVQHAAAQSSAGSASAKITVTARVLERTRLRVINQAQEFVVTTADILRGYVAVPAASRINITSNNPHGYFLIFEVMSGPENVFSSISVDTGGREVQLSLNGGWIHQPFIRASITTDLNYRFELSRDVKPGTYRFPLTVSILRM